MASSYVLDAGAFYSGIPFLSSSGKYFTTHAVFNEIRHIKRSYAALEALLDSGNLRLAEPNQDEVELVATAARKTGDFGKLSKADISVLALALGLEKATLVTEDYAVANVATVMKILVKSTSNKGIKETRKWTIYCSACSRTFSSDVKECPLCGNKLSRKYKKKLIKEL